MKPLTSYLVAIVMALLLSGHESRAYSGHSVGIRVGNHFAADYKYYMSRHSALDFSFGLVNPFYPQYQFLLVSGAYNFHIGSGVTGLTPYIGGGLSLGTQFGDPDMKRRDRVDFFFSLDIPVGIEYRLQRKPVTFFLEWSPKCQIVSDLRFISQSAAIGIRFVLPYLR